MPTCLLAWKLTSEGVLVSDPSGLRPLHRLHARCVVLRCWDNLQHELTAVWLQRSVLAGR